NSFLQTKKQEKTKLLLIFFYQIIINNRYLFLITTLLAVFTAIVNYNIGTIFRTNFFHSEDFFLRVANEIKEETKNNNIKNLSADEIKNNYKNLFEKKRKDELEKFEFEKE